ncbi:hypothetical protein [Chengkuizengella sediminis]|uniref:hypothetical protein n=1 Tax=Chengkuizengella sediminis TaxID=1885917 RepID=UPI00138A6607|nr:hypothetical protein [Chengkuizengella sediminis]NDI34748.1 hypothetical protein [Chengkuizengella sediminis]
MGASKNLKWVTGGLEAILGIPILGGSIVLGLAWTPLIIMLVLHIITLAVCSKEGSTKTPSIVGIITSCIAWIPIVGMIMHIITAILLLVSAAKSSPEVSRTY